MQTFIALSGNLTRATLDHPNGVDKLPVVIMAFEVAEDGGPVEIVVDAENLHLWLTSALAALEDDLVDDAPEAEADPA